MTYTFCFEISLHNWPSSTNNAVGERGQGTWTSHGKYSLEKFSVQARLFNLLCEREGLRDEVGGSFKGEQASIDQQVVEFWLRAVGTIIMAQIIFCFAVAPFNELDGLGAGEVKMRAHILDAPGQWREDIHMQDPRGSTSEE